MDSAERHDYVKGLVKKVIHVPRCADGRNRFHDQYHNKLIKAKWLAIEGLHTGAGSEECEGRPCVVDSGELLATCSAIASSMHHAVR